MDPITPANVDKVIRAVIADPACSFWLRGALKEALTRDIVDAANDAELLSLILSAKAEKALRGGL